MTTRNQNAFTFVEVMITVVASTAIIAGIYATFIIGNRAFLYYNENIPMRQEVRRALYSMTNELREARNIFIEEEPQAVKINFYRPTIGIISYVWHKSGKNKGKIIRKNYDSERMLAKDISLLAFHQETTDEISIKVATGEDENFSLQEKIALRAKTNYIKPTKKRHEKADK